MAVAQCPASCGELIQGWILGSEKLVSCPVDWYSTVEVDYGSPRADERPLARAMVDHSIDNDEVTADKVRADRKEFSHRADKNI